MQKCWVGIDNGCTGAIGVIYDDGNYSLIKTPTFKEYSYTKKRQKITLIDFQKMYALLKIYKDYNSSILIERPMINPMRFKATISAVRALETTQNILRLLKLKYDWVDSKQWQKELLPNGVSGVELKEASLQVGVRLFPRIDWKNFKDADAILLCEYCRRHSS